MMRTQKSILNTSVAFGAQIIFIMLGFLSRRVLIYSVGIQYLGINGLMTNILTVFSLAEAGIGVAIGYSLYKPLAEKNIEKIKSYMRFYRNTYRILAIFTIVIGSCFYPFLPYFLTGNTAPDVDIIYFLFLGSAACSYLWSYKVTLNNSDQNSYLYTIANTITQILVLIIKILILYITENYILYLTIEISSTLIKNLIFTKFVDKRYPYLADDLVKPLEKSEKQTLFHNIKALFIGKFGYVISQCSDNLVISSMISITTVGLYSNYTTLISAVSGFVTTFSNGVIASMGNLIASESKEKAYEVYRKIDFINGWLYTFTSVCLLCLIEPFIQIWLGAEYILSKSLLIIIVLSYYLRGINSGIDIVKSAAGLFYPDRYIPVLEALLNLGLSIYLAQTYGLEGILFATLISFIFFSFWIKPFLVYKYIFEISFIQYIVFEGKKIVIFFIIAGITYYAQSFIHADSWLWDIMLKIIVSSILSNLLLVIFFFRNPEFSYIMVLLRKVRNKLVYK